MNKQQASLHLEPPPRGGTGTQLRGDLLGPRPGVANFVLCDLTGDAPDAATLAERTRERGLFIRDFPSDPVLRWRAFRVAIKDRQTNVRLTQILEDVLADAVIGAADTEESVASSV